MGRGALLTMNTKYLVLFQHLQSVAQTQRHLLMQKQTEMPPSVDHPAGGQNICSDTSDIGVLISPL